MKNYFALFTAFLITDLTLTGCAKQPRGLTVEKNILAVGVEIGYPPMEYYDTDGVSLAGFDIELVRALADKLGFQAKFIDTAWEGILAGLDTNKYDIAINITMLPERQKKYNFTKPYIDSSITMVTRKESPVKIEKPGDIGGHRVAYQSDTTAQYFTEKLSAQGIQFSSFGYDKILNCFDDLKLERLDVIVVDNIAALHYAGKENSPFEIVWQGASGEFISICLKKGNDALTIALDNALDDLFADGTMLQISQKIFNRDLVSSIKDI
jgi:polar amino acid transport system substrate-binding protein